MAHLYTHMQTKDITKGNHKDIGNINLHSAQLFWMQKKKLRWNFGFPNIEGNSKAGELINHAAKGL